MELQVTKKPVTAFAGKWETRLELPMETELLVPDYQPAVFKIVKCLVQPVILQNAVEGRHWQLGGYLRCTVYYQSDEAGSFLCRTEQKYAFEKTVELPEGAYLPTPGSLCCELEYCNCRAVNEHRIDLRGAYAVNAAFCRVAEREVLVEVGGCGMQTFSKCLTGGACVAAEEKNSTTESILELPGSGETVLDVDGYVVQESTNVENGGAFWQGKLCVQAIYRPAGSEEMVSVQKEIPVQQRLDWQDAAEGDRLYCWARINACTLTAAEDGSGQPELTVNWKLHAELWRPISLSAVQDAYSTECAVAVQTAPLPLLQLSEPVSETVHIAVEDELPQPDCQVKGCFVTVDNIRPIAEEQHTRLGGKGSAHVICMDSRGELTCYDKGFEWSLPWNCDIPAKDIVLQMTAVPALVTSRKKEKNMAVSVELNVSGTVMIAQSAQVVENLEPGEAFLREPGNPALHLYYVREPESLFEIAKRYHAKVEDIAVTNRLEGTEGVQPGEWQAQSQCLLIPAAL